MSFADILTRVLHAERVEPVKRNKDGVRWIVHRFPIKGGISLAEAQARDFIAQKNAMYAGYAGGLPR